MEILQCDNCKAQSPDQKGYHIANSWTFLRVKNSKIISQYFDANASEEIMLCNDCLPLPDNGKSFAKSIVEFFTKKGEQNDHTKRTN
jgi:hypothetical protein